MYAFVQPPPYAAPAPAPPFGVFTESYRRVGLGAAPAAARRPARVGGPNPPYRIRPFSGAKDTLEAMARAALGPRGEQSFPVRQFAEDIVRHVEPKDYLGEILAVRNIFVQRGPTGSALVRYTNDPLHVELIKDPERLVEEIRAHGSTLADCDEIVCLAGTCCLQLGRVVEWMALGFGGGRSEQLTHVGLRVQEPKSGRWIWLDGVAGPREREAAATATRKLGFSLA